VHVVAFSPVLMWLSVVL